MVSQGRQGRLERLEPRGPRAIPDQQGRPGLLAEPDLPGQSSAALIPRPLSTRPARQSSNSGTYVSIQSNGPGTAVGADTPGTDPTYLGSHFRQRWKTTPASYVALPSTIGSPVFVIPHISVFAAPPPFIGYEFRLCFPLAGDGDGAGRGHLYL